jgi:cell division GTPase FtsZ
MNIDLADFKRVMGIPGVAVMCRGESRCTVSKRNPILDATEWALGHPMADMQLKGAKGVLVSFCGNSEVATAQYADALDSVRREVNPNVDWALGVFEPEGVGYDCVRVTLIVTGIDIPQTGE